MSAQVAEPQTPPRGFPALRPARPAPSPEPLEFHPISVVMTEDVTEVTCMECGPLEHTGRAFESHTAHGAQHAMVTGHIVTERHVRVTVITGHPV